MAGPAVAAHVIETSTTTGTGTITLDGALTGYMRFRDVPGATDGDPIVVQVRNLAHTKGETLNVTLSLGTGAGGKDQLVIVETLASSTVGVSPTKINWLAGDAPLYVFSGAAAPVVDSLVRQNYGTARPAWLRRGFWTDAGASAAARLLKWWTGTADITFATVDETANKIDLSARKITLTGGLIEALGASVAGASTTEIWATDGGVRHITGSGATIASLGTAVQAGQRMTVIFDGAHTLAHGANLDIPGNANITTAAGDRAEVLAETTTASRITSYTRESGFIADLGLVLTTQGDVLVRGASAPERLAYGRSGKVLTTGGSGATPSWSAAAAIAFVRFVGGSGAIVGTAFNVSSVTRNAAGDYTVNFSPSLPSANYNFVATGAVPAANSLCNISQDGNTAPTASACRFFSLLMNSGDSTVYRADPTTVCITFYDAT